MKRTFRSLLSMVMALSMLLSMVLISGLTASAANAQVMYIPASKVNYSGNGDTGALQATLTPSADGNGWTLTQSADALSGAPVASVIINDTQALQDLPYLVLEVGEGNTMNMGWAVWSETSGTINPWAWPLVQSAGVYVCDLSKFVKPGETLTMSLWTYSAAGAVYNVKSLYLSDVNPNAAPIKYIRAENFTQDAISQPSGVTFTNHASGKGFDVTLTADFAAGGAGGIINVDNSDGFKYLVIEVPTSTMTNWGFTALTGGWTHANSTGRWVMDVSAITSHSEYIWVGGAAGATLTVNACYLTNIHPDDAINTINVVDATTAVFQGSTFTKTAYGINVPAGGYAYLAIPETTVAEYPYFYYKLSAQTTPTAYYHLGDNWLGNMTALDYSDTNLHCIDLRTIPSYGDGGYVALHVYSAGEVDMEVCLLADKDTFVYDGSADAVTNHTVLFDTNGGSVVYGQLVPDGGTVDAVTTTMDGYTFGGWYTDEALTQAFDFVTPVTASMTLYAKWTLAGDLSPAFGQLPTDTTAESASASIRFVSVIDSLQYAEVGFVISKVTANPTVDDAYSLAVSTTTVWTSINAAGSTVTAEELHGTYIFACTVNNIPQANFSTPLYVRAYVKDFNGNYTYTDAKTYSVTDMLG